jgi:ankyrin repeat protein
MLIETGHVNVNSKDVNGWTPLFYTTLCEHEDMITLLLENEATVDNKRHLRPDTAVVYGLASARWRSHALARRIL